jgi:hypothetical protein
MSEIDVLVRDQFVSPDLGHRMMRVLWRTLGFMKISPGQATEARA